MTNSVVKIFRDNLELSENLISENSKSNNSRSDSQKNKTATFIEKILAKRNQLLTNVRENLKKPQIFRLAEFLHIYRTSFVTQIAKEIFAPPIEGNICCPREGEVSSGQVQISGRAKVKSGEIDKIEAFIGDTQIGEIPYFSEIFDVSGISFWRNKSRFNFETVLKFNSANFDKGLNLLKIRISDNKGNVEEHSRTIIIGNGHSLPLIKEFSNNLFPSPLGEKTFAESQKNYPNLFIENKPDLAKQRHQSVFWKYRPLISIMTPIIRSETDLTDETIKSVTQQSYENWELYLVVENSINSQVKDSIFNYARQNPKIRVIMEPQSNSFNFSNEALKIANGEFAAFLNPSDQLAPNALFENVLLLQENPQADMIYSDEDYLDLKGNRCHPHFKPDWSPDFFYSTMYSGNLSLFRRSLFNKIGGFKADFKEAQLYDLVLRLIEQTNRIFHIPKVLYHNGQKTQIFDVNSRIKALTEHFNQRNIEVKISQGLTENLLRVKRKLLKQPLVSIIIPTCDKVDFLENCIRSIGGKTKYSNYEIIVVDNNSSSQETFTYFEKISQAHNIRIIKYQKPFNFSAINNFAVTQANGELLLFLNNDTEIISGEWLESMIEHAVRPEVGAVGARLLYFNGTVQHAGIITGILKIAGHSHKNYSENHQGYYSRAKAIQNVSAVTGACLMVRTDLFKSLGGFNQDDLPIAYNDLDFCLRIREQNLLIVYTPYSELYHYESASRGSDQTLNNSQRFYRESKFMLERWGNILRSDPYYNLNLTLEREDFSFAGFEKLQ